MDCHRSLEGEEHWGLCRAERLEGVCTDSRGRTTRLRLGRRGKGGWKGDGGQGVFYQRVQKFTSFLRNIIIGLTPCNDACNRM